MRTFTLRSKYNFNIAIIEYNGKFGYVTKGNKVIGDISYDKCEDFNEYGIAFFIKNDYYGVIDKTGKFLITPDKYIDKYNNNELLRLNLIHFQDKKCNNILINYKTGEEIFNLKSYINFEYINDDTLLITDNNFNINLYSISKNKMLLDTFYCNIGDFNYGIATIHDDFANYGIINDSGTFITPLCFNQYSIRIEYEKIINQIKINTNRLNKLYEI
jgi:hypothetical protein